MILQDFFNENPKVALGFSGGVDSSYLLYEGIRCGADIKAYYIKTAFQPEFEFEDARRLAYDIGADMSVIEADILFHKLVTDNPSNRCYYCKQIIFSTLKEQAALDGYDILIDGSNASDDDSDRPGMRALEELSVKSPLRKCGLTKADVRRLSKEAGLFTWDKPSYACLATRIPAGHPITAELLHKVECAEDALFAMGFRDFRVRILGDAAKVQLHDNDMEKAFKCREEIISALKQYFVSVLLDLESRQGE